MNFELKVTNVLHLAHIFVWQIPISVKLQSQIFYIWQPHLFLQTYDHLCIPCLSNIFVFFFSLIPIPFENVHSYLSLNMLFYMQCQCL